MEATVDLDDALIAALQQAAWDPTRALRPPYRRLPWNSQPHPPATPAQLDESERRLGFRLPQAVRRLYGLVANGGFGPGHGLLGLVGGAVDEFGHTAVDSYLASRREGAEDPRWQWPWGLLPVCTWGCAVYSCVDCRPGIPQPPMVAFAPGGEDGWAWSFVGEGRTLPRWLHSWVAGEDVGIRTNALSVLCGPPVRWPWDGAEDGEAEPVAGPPGTCPGQLPLFG
jgi:hypothetical protein